MANTTKKQQASHFQYGQKHNPFRQKFDFRKGNPMGAKVANSRMLQMFSGKKGK